MFGRIGIKWHIPQPCRTGSVPRAQRFCEFCSGFEKTMNDVAYQYENEVDHSVNRFLGIIEPAIIILCSLIVGVILLSVMLPLLSIMSSI